MWTVCIGHEAPKTIAWGLVPTSPNKRLQIAQLSWRDDKMIKTQSTVSEAASAEPDTRPAWIVPEVDVIDVRETHAAGLGNNDGIASHT